MTKQEYQNSVMVRLKLAYHIPWQHLDSVRNTIINCFDKSFSLFDCVDYLKCTEEVNPDISEDVALKRMSEINSRYYTDPATVGE